MFPGIGIETAEKLIDRHDEDILQLLNTSPSEIAKRLDINSDVAEIICKGWDNNKEKFLTEIFLRELTFSNTQIKAIQASMHGEIIEILVRRPLELLGRIPRLTFSQIETIYCKLDRELTDEEKHQFGEAFIEKARTDSSASDQLTEVLSSSGSVRDSIYFRKRMKLGKIFEIKG